MPARQRQLFVEQFEKDLSFFQLFFLLANKSSVIKHMGILWAEDGPAAELGLGSIVSTREAIRSACSPCLSCDPELDPEFCGIVSGFGRYESESCGISDRAAALRCRETGQTQIYECHAGLIDVAVPVISGADYIGTLLWGQVLGGPPTAEGFERIRKRLSGLAHIDFVQLEKAYWNAPVVTEEELRNTAPVVEAFAQYVATSWGRLSDLIRVQARTIREAQLLQKELANVLLDPASNRMVLRELLGKLGFTHTPNRVLVVQLETEEEYSGATAAFDVAFTAALQAVEDIAEEAENVAAAHLNRRGLCVFMHDPSSTPFRAYALARKLLRVLAERCALKARIGIGDAIDAEPSLADSYHQAFTALAQSTDTVAVYRLPVAPSTDLFARTEEINALLTGRRVPEALLAIRSLPMLVNRSLGEAAHGLTEQQRFFNSTLSSIGFCAKQLGADRESVDRILSRADVELRRAHAPIDLHEFFVDSAEKILDEVRRLYRSRREKMVDRSCRIIREHVDRGEPGGHISSSVVAAQLGVSVSNLERTFKQATGCTVERFIMTQRVEFAKRLLLDPSYNVSQVAEKCGFSEPAYFARVFRKIAGCTPTEYMKSPLTVLNPSLIGASAAASTASAPSTHR